jgi:hypothetical protein
MRTVLIGFNFYLFLKEMDLQPKEFTGKYITATVLNHKIIIDLILDKTQDRHRWGDLIQAP